LRCYQLQLKVFKDIRSGHVTITCMTLGVNRHHHHEYRRSAGLGRNHSPSPYHGSNVVPALGRVVGACTELAPHPRPSRGRRPRDWSWDEPGPCGRHCSSSSKNSARPCSNNHHHTANTATSRPKGCISHRTDHFRGAPAKVGLKPQRRAPQLPQLLANREDNPQEIIQNGLLHPDIQPLTEIRRAHRKQSTWERFTEGMYHFYRLYEMQE